MRLLDKVRHPQLHMVLPKRYCLPELHCRKERHPMTAPDLSWFAIGMHQYVGPSELEKYRKAYADAGFEMREGTPGWYDDVKFTRVG